MRYTHAVLRDWVPQLEGRTTLILEMTMADEADQAHELEQLALTAALAQRKTGFRLMPKGICHNCNEHLKPKKGPNGLEHVKIFCDKNCSDDWESRERAKRQLRG
jgi:hypothetical protein